MGCSRPGALAGGCVLVAGVMTLISLLLPYWSKMKLDVVTQDHLEVTFGLWGSCINLQPTNPATLDSPVVTNGSEVIAITPESAASETLTCGSFFNHERVRITCTNFRQLASGQCARRDYEADGTLCDSQTATAFLGGGVKSKTVISWLRFLETACRTTGRASIAFAFLCSACTGLATIFLVIGITCARIDSSIGKLGGVCAAVAAVIQLIIATLWVIEFLTIREEQVVLGTSFYLNIISILFHSLACVAVKKHRKLEEDARQEHEVGDLEDVKHMMSQSCNGSNTTNNGDVVAV